MTNKEIQEYVFDLIRAERKWQNNKHPEVTPADKPLALYRNLTILIEEVGEVAEDILEGKDPGAELVQVAAVAVAWLEGMLREEYGEKNV